MLLDTTPVLFTTILHIAQCPTLGGGSLGQIPPLIVGMRVEAWSDYLCRISGVCNCQEG
jgi:hypothetical protein